MTRRTDLELIDALARVQVAARRLGWTARFWVGRDVVELAELVGLRDALELGREAEDGEQARVDEVVVADDPVA